MRILKLLLISVTILTAWSQECKNEVCSARKSATVDSCKQQFMTDYSFFISSESSQISKSNCPRKGVGKDLKDATFVSLNNTYAISLELKLSWWGSQQWCRSRGFQLGSIDGVVKERELTAHLAKNLSDLRLWTSGTNFVVNNSVTFYWESLGKPIQLRNVFSRETRKLCLSVPGFVIDKDLWLAENCSTKNNFFCDVPKSCVPGVSQTPFTTQKPKYQQQLVHETLCPAFAKVPCSRKDSYFNANGMLQVPPNLGELVNVCGKQIFISKDETTFNQYYGTCCSLGMQIASVETLKCMAELLKSVSSSTRNIFLTGLTRRSCQAQYASCPEGILHKNSDLPWILGEPSCPYQAETAAALVVTKKTVGLFPTNPDGKLLYFCESEGVTSNSMQEIDNATRNALLAVSVAKPRNGVPSSYMFTSEKFPSCAASMCKTKGAKYDKSGNLIVDPKDGRVIQACGKTYLISKALKTSRFTWQTCCSFGMYVASFETKAQLDCFLNELKDSIKTRTFYNVASHDQVNFKRNFTWCRKGNKTIDEDLWLPGDPNNYKNAEGCVSLLAFPSPFGGLVDLSSIHSFPTLCEDPRYQDEQEKQRTMTSPEKKLR